MNRFQMIPGLEGIYQVGKSRALHWPCKDGKPLIWATAGQFVDLRSPFMMELVQTTGQLHKLAKVTSKIPKGKRLLGEADAPAAVRDALRRYEEGLPAQPAAPRTHADDRKLDASQLPSAAAPVETAGEPDPKGDTGVTSEPAPKTAAKKGSQKEPGASEAKEG